MWLPLLIRNIYYENGGGTYDRSSFITNNLFTFIWLNCRNYRCICLNYTGYNFKQINNKKTHLLIVV